MPPQTDDAARQMKRGQFEWMRQVVRGSHPFDIVQRNILGAQTPIERKTVPVQFVTGAIQGVRAVRKKRDWQECREGGEQYRDERDAHLRARDECEAYDGYGRQRQKDAAVQQHAASFGRGVYFVFRFCGFLSGASVHLMRLISLQGFAL